MRRRRNNNGIRIVVTFVVIVCIAASGFLGVKWNQLKNENMKLQQMNNDRNKEIKEHSKSLAELESEKESLKGVIEECESEKTELDAANKDLVHQIDVLKGNEIPEETTMSESQYSELYPEMNVLEETPSNEDKKIVYLTFDDGPSNLTPEFLKVLKSYGVHATFFVTYQPHLEEIYKQEVEEGHKVQIHTATHEFNSIYQSVETYLADFEKMYTYIGDITGQKPDCFRFPGGSTNSYGASTSRDIAKELTRRGFNFFDWNVSVGDGNANATRTSILEKIKAESAGKNTIVLLAHDSGTKQETLAALPQIIEYYQSNGYEFGIIDRSVDASIAQHLSY